MSEREPIDLVRSLQSKVARQSDAVKAVQARLRTAIYIISDLRRENQMLRATLAEQSGAVPVPIIGTINGGERSSHE